MRIYAGENGVTNKPKIVDAKVIGFTQNAPETSYDNQPDIPCIYQTQVDIQIILITYNRAESVKTNLNTLQTLVLYGDSGAIEVWIDRTVNNTVDEKTIQVVNTFQCKYGPVTIHIQKKHVGICGQWIDTWRPKEYSSELAIILEDDVDLSPYAYRWLKAAFCFCRLILL